MFEDDDWDITEEDLNFNIDDLENFTKSNDVHNSSFKQFSGVEEKSSINNSQANINENIYYKKFKNDNNEHCLDTAYKKNNSIKIFNKINAIKKNYKSKPDNSEAYISLEDSVPSCSYSNITNDQGKKFVLNVLQQDQNGEQCSASKSKIVFKSALKINDPFFETENKLKRKKNVAFEESLYEFNISKKVCASIENRLPKKLLNNINLNEIGQLRPKNLEQNVEITCNSNFNDTSTTLDLNLLLTPLQKNIKIPCIKKTVTRKFPGPAGLIPDDVNDSEAIDLNTLDENQNNRYKKYAELCSQNTKNLFTTGGWQLMMDDLPSNFELYDIATIKENAIEYSKNYKKVPYFAGIIQCIDYKPNDPQVILKDLTGKINAHIHHSICKLYPNALGTNVVILVKDAGLIVTSKKYVCMIISPKNLISMYSDDVRLMETTLLEKLHVKELQTNL